MTDKTVEQMAAGLTDIQREAIMRAKAFPPLTISLTDWMEDSWDITEDLSEEIADPVCGELTPLGLAIRNHLLGEQQ